MNIKTEFLLPVMVLFANNSYALDWLFDPNFSFKERYEDNLRMQIHPQRDNLISTVSPGLMFGYLSDDSELKTNLNWNHLIYHGQSALDFDEKLANFSHEYKSDRFKTDLTAAYTVQSSFNTQPNPTTVNQNAPNDLANQVARTTRSAAPSVTYNLTEKNALQLGYNYVDVSFDKHPNLSFSDYTNQQFSATAIHTYSQRLSFNLTGSYSEFDSAGESSGFTFGIPSTTKFNQKSNTLNYQAGLQYTYDEQTQLSLSAGMRNTDTQSTSLTKFTGSNIIINNSSQSSSTSGHVFSAGLNRNGEWGSFNLSAGQQLNPASTGSQQQSTSFSANASYNLSERWSTGINASYLIAESVSGNGVSNNSKQTYTVLAPNLMWRWTPEINLDLSYTHREQEYQSLSQTAMGNSVQLQFSYQPQINRQVK